MKKTHGILPKVEVTRVLWAQVLRARQAFANIAAFTNLAACFVLFLLRRAHLTKSNVNIGWELQSGPVEGAGFLL